MKELDEYFQVSFTNRISLVDKPDWSSPVGGVLSLGAEWVGRSLDLGIMDIGRLEIVVPLPWK